MLTSDDETFGNVDPLSTPSPRSAQNDVKTEEFEDIFGPHNNGGRRASVASDAHHDDYRNNVTEEVNVDLSTEYQLIVDISDALSERDKVKYTVHTKTDMPQFSKREMSVVREHEEFIWLHDCLQTNEEYAGFMIPPAPPRPDFDASREKLQKLGEGESTMTKEEFLKMKQELEQEYLATFKKTVAMHEVFLCRLAAHPIFRKNANFHVFLEYDNELCVRGKNKKELVGSFFKRVSQSADEVLLSGQKDIDEFFEHEKNYLLEYHSHIKEATAKADRVCRSRKNVADSYAKIASSLEKIGLSETNGGDKDFGIFLYKASDVFERLKKAESRVGTDEELKEADTLRYFTRETQAGKDLLYRRLRCLANYEGANKALERARARNRDIPKAEQEQADACKKFEDIGVVARGELLDLKKRRVEAFRKNLAELVELEIKQSKNKLMIIGSALDSLRSASTFSNGKNVIGNVLPSMTPSAATRNDDDSSDNAFSIHQNNDNDAIDIKSTLANSAREQDINLDCESDDSNKEAYSMDNKDEENKMADGAHEATPPLISNPLSSDLSGDTSD